MKTKYSLSLLAIVGMAAILLMPGQFAESNHSNTPSTGDDFLLGHGGGDIIDGLAGNDQIFGFGSSDILRGSAGDDMMLGGSSSDKMFGGPDRDFMFGGSGGDKIMGGLGDDEIFGGGQGDSLYGEDGNDEIYGGFQSDIIFGGDGDDIISGGPHSDNLFGEGDDDKLYGGAKNDNIFAGAGRVEATGTVTCVGVLAGDTLTLNGLVYTAVAGPKDLSNTQFSIDSDTICAADLADSITNDLRTPITVPSLDQTATSGSPIVTIISEEGLQGNNVDLVPSADALTSGRLVVSGFTLKGDIDDFLFGGINNDNLIGSTQGSVFLDGGEDDDDFDGLFNEDPLNFDQFGAPIDDDGDGIFNEDGPGNDHDNCWWDGGPTRLLSDPDGIPNTGDEIFGDDVLALDDFGDLTCENVKVLGLDSLEISGGKKGGGSGDPPQIISAVFTETSPDLVAPFGEKDFLSGFITLTFGKVVSANTDAQDTLDRTTIGPLGALIFPLSAGSVVLPNKELEITYTLTEDHISLLLGINLDPDLFPAISVEENVYKDKFGNGNVQQFAIISMNLVDFDPPILTGSSYVTGSGLLTIAFDELVDPSSVDIILPSGIHVRVPGASSGGVEVTSPISVIAVGDTLEILLTDPQRVLINALIDVPVISAPNTIELDVDAGAVTDLNSIPVGLTTDTVIFVLSDTTLPFILSATFDESFNLLTISFNENIDVTPDTQVSLGTIHVSESAGTDDVVLTGATVLTAVDGNPVTIEVTPAQKLAINALLTPVLDVDAGSFLDLTGNTGVAQVVPLTLSPTDVTPPSITNVEFDESFGFLRITFDEEVDLTPDSQVDLSKVFISETGFADQTPLTGASHATSSDNDILELELTAAQITTLTGLTSPQLDVQADAFQDPKGNLILATADNDIDMGSPTDVTKPTISKVEFITATGVLEITFDDIIDVSESDLDKVFISKNKKRNQNSLIGQPIISGDSAKVEINIDAGLEGIILGLGPLAELDVGKNAFTDDAGNRSDKDENIPITII